MSRPQVSVILAGADVASRLASLLPGRSVCVGSSVEFHREVARRDVLAVGFVDASLLSQLDGDRVFVPVIALLDPARASMLSRSVALLDTYSWLSHSMATSVLVSDFARAHLSRQIQRLAYGEELPLILPGGGSGRVALLTHASRRDARFERMHAFFNNHGLSPRTIAGLTEVAEELVMNALYDAPLEGGYFRAAVQRTEDVALPPERACEISYGVCDSAASVRVRDTFGAFTRARLLDVLRRCNQPGVMLDETRGGAGLGLWRIFSTATAISVTVVRGTLTDVSVRIALKDGRPAAKELQALDFHFGAAADEDFAPDPENSLFDQSVTITRCA